MREAVVRLEPHRAGAGDADLLAAAVRLAADIRKDPDGSAIDSWLARRDELYDDGTRRERWVEAALNDLRRRWKSEIRDGDLRYDDLTASHRYTAGVDADRQRERVETLVERRLARLATGQGFVDEVDRLVEEGLRRHRACVRRLLADETREAEGPGS